MQRWQHALEKSQYAWKPYMQLLYIDLLKGENTSPKGIHLGFKSGTGYVIEHLKTLENNRVNHVIINLKYGSRPVEEVLEELGESVLPYFL